MVLKLFEISSHVIRNAVLDGEILNVGELSVVLRRWIFELFRTKNLLNDENVVELFCQPGFFDGFTKIDVFEKERSEWRLMTYSEKIDHILTGLFVPSLLTIFGANSPLAENITDLRLRISGISGCRCDQMYGCPPTETVGRLLGLCKNLCSLLLFVCYGSVFDCLSELHSFSEIAEVQYPALEHLSLMSNGGSRKLTESEFPKRFFYSLQTLSLCPVPHDEQMYSDILAHCQNTLTSLDVLCGCLDSDIVSPVPIRLPKLTSLSCVTSIEPRINFQDILEHCPNLMTGTLRLKIDRFSRSELAAMAELSKRLQFEIRYVGRSANVQQFFEMIGENVTVFSVSCDASRLELCQQILLNSSHFRCLSVIGANSELFPSLECLLDDSERAAKLTELCLGNSLSSTVLKSVFINCCCLRRLKLQSYGDLFHIDNHLQMWIENGVRLTTVALTGFYPIHPETVYALMKASGHDLKEITLPILVTDETVYETCLNVLVNHCSYVQVCRMKYSVPCKYDKIAQLRNKYERLCFMTDPFNKWEIFF